MKTRARLLTTLIATVLPCSQALAGSYDPERIDLYLAPGEGTTVEYTYSDPSAFFVQPFVNMSGDADLQGWIGDIRAAMGSGDSTASMTINVPADAASGQYEIVLYGRAWGGAHAPTDDGMTLAVTVAGACAGTADFVQGSENDIELWAPNRALHSIELLGEIEVPDGCTILTATYDVDDEYGVYSSSGELEITGDAEGYLATPLIEASRSGKDKDGRVYTVTLSIETEAGVATQTRRIVVLHDRRDKAEDKRGKPAN